MRRVDLETAQAYLDFTSRDGTVDRSLADLQLEASVALHNLLCERNSAYLADEVGMGKTYVALGVVALFRRANPNARVLYLSPRKNLQEKWVKELHQFVAHNCRQSDDRMRNRFGRPARPMVSCENLEAFAQECSLGQPRDVFLRTTSFSFGLAEEVDYHVKARTLVEYAGSRMPPPSVLRDKEAFKAWYGMELYRIAPVFDLVIVDEAHNLRRGPNQSDRNQMLNRMLTGGMGNPGPRKAANLLLVSATPFDRNMGDIYRQAQVFGHESGFEPLLPMDNPTVDSPERDRIFLESCMVRRLQAVQGLSRNQYRKEWRLGGMVNPETGMPDMDHLQQLMVALVQKKTCESIDNPEFGNAFQMGLLASFESFRESRRSALAPKVFDTKVEAAPPDLDIKNLAEREPRDREGIDSDRLEKVMLSFRRKFGYPMPHPKMKAVAEGLERSLAIGEKVLIFVNRVRSVDELKELLDLWIDRKVRDELMGRLPKSRGKWRDAYKNFQAEKAKGREVRNQKDTPNPESLMDANQEEGAVAEAFRERPSLANFFTWLCTKGPVARFKDQLHSADFEPALVFEENWVQILLATADPLPVLAQRKSLSVDATRIELDRLAHALFDDSRRGTSEMTTRPWRQVRRLFLAYQKAGLFMISQGIDARAENAKLILTRFHGLAPSEVAFRPQTLVVYPEGHHRFLSVRTLSAGLLLRPSIHAMLPNLALDPNRHWTRPELARRLFLWELICSELRLGASVLDLFVVCGPRPNFLDHQEGVINGMQSWNRQGHAGGEPLRSSRRQGAAHALLLLKGPAARVENA